MKAHKTHDLQGVDGKVTSPMRAVAKNLPDGFTFGGYRWAAFIGNMVKVEIPSRGEVYLIDRWGGVWTSDNEANLFGEFIQPKGKHSYRLGIDYLRKVIGYGIS